MAPLSTERGEFIGALLGVSRHRGFMEGMDMVEEVGSFSFYLGSGDFGVPPLPSTTLGSRKRSGESSSASVLTHIGVSPHFKKIHNDVGLRLAKTTGKSHPPQ